MQKKLNFVVSCREVCNFVERNEYFNRMDSINQDNYFINEERREVVRLLDRLQLQLEEQLHDISFWFSGEEHKADVLVRCRYDLDRIHYDAKAL